MQPDASYKSAPETRIFTLEPAPETRIFTLEPLQSPTFFTLPWHIPTKMWAECPPPPRGGGGDPGFPWGEGGIMCVYAQLHTIAQSAKSLYRAPGSNLTRKGCIGAILPFRVNDDQEISQLDSEYMTQSWVSLNRVICQVCRKLAEVQVPLNPNLPGLFCELKFLGGGGGGGPPLRSRPWMARST